MEMRALGRRGIVVTSIGLGLAALGRPGYINLGHGADLDDRSVEGMRLHAHAMLDHAYACGVRYFDVARSYGRGEEFLADWLGATGGDVAVGSKWGYTYTADWEVDAEVHEVKDHRPTAFERQLAESRQLLGDRLDLYQIHSATLETGVLDDLALHRRLAVLREDGVAVGLTTSGPEQAAAIRRALEVTVDGVALFDTVQATWNLLEPSAGPALAEAADAGLGVIVKEAVANGRLTSRNRDLPAPLAAHPSPDAVAMAAALAQPWATVVLSGAATLAQLDANLDALAIDPAAVSALPDLAEPPRRYWETRSALAWT